MQPEYTERLLNPKMEYYRDCYKNSPRWDGEDDLSGKRVIVYGEQGYGDIIQFARYIPLLKQKGCEIYVHCSTTLHKLLLEDVEGVSSCFEDEVPEHHCHIPSMSLPFLLNTTDADVPYIEVKDEEKIEGFDSYFKIGIAWEGNPNHSNNHERSCPLAVFRKIHDLDRVKLFMIQPQTHLSKLCEGCDDMEILGTELTDFHSTAKLVKAMDLIVSVDTSVMHLAGAMGKRTLCLLSHRYDPRWDLGLDWYPSVKLIKQKFTGDWAGLVSELQMHVTMNLQKWAIKNPKLS